MMMACSIREGEEVEPASHAAPHLAALGGVDDEAAAGLGHRQRKGQVEAHQGKPPVAGVPVGRLEVARWSGGTAAAAATDAVPIGARRPYVPHAAALVGEQRQRRVVRRHLAVGRGGAMARAKGWCGGGVLGG